jgi:hypothetical protein
MSNFNKLTILCLIILAVSCFNVIQTVEEDTRVKIDFFYESLCPYCQQYITKSLKVAANTKVNFIFY